MQFFSSIFPLTKSTDVEMKEKTFVNFYYIQARREKTQQNCSGGNSRSSKKIQHGEEEKMFHVFTRKKNGQICSEH